ncbi:MAG: hypothetical protein ACTSUT_16160 [Promethearchaeota archaeon]
MNSIKKFLLSKRKVEIKEIFFTCISLVAVFSFPLYVLSLIIKDFYNYYCSNRDDVNAILSSLAIFGISIAIIIKLNGYNDFKETISRLPIAIFRIVKYLIIILLIIMIILSIVWIINSWNNLADMEKLQWIGFLIIFLLITIIVKDKW